MLNSCRVLDLTTERGHLCGQILGDLGADVIKVEPPGGSPIRKIGPFYNDQPHPDRSLFFWAFNRNKRSITLNLDTHEGRELVYRLTETAQIFVESDNPGHFAARWMGYNDLRERNPALVYVSIAPFGQEGPKAHYADSDLIIWAAGGPLSVYGDPDRPPIRISAPQAYLFAGGEGAVGALIAYHERIRSGLGQYVDISAQESVARATQSNVLSGAINAKPYQRTSGGAMFGDTKVKLVWKTRDGFVTFFLVYGAAGGPRTAKLMRHIYDAGECDRETADKDYINFGHDLALGNEAFAEHERILGVVTSFVEKRTKAEMIQLAEDCGFPLAPVTTIDEVLAHPHFRAREFWQTVVHPELGKSFTYPGPPVKLSAKPISIRRRPPTIGEHNHEIYVGELGLSEAEFDGLKRKGII